MLMCLCGAHLTFSAAPQGQFVVLIGTNKNTRAEIYGPSPSSFGAQTEWRRAMYKPAGAVVIRKHFGDLCLGI